MHHISSLTVEQQLMHEKPAVDVGVAPCCVILVLTPAILPFQLNRQYISGRHVSLPLHPFM